MKKIIFTAALLVSCISFQFANAQLRVHVNLNIGNQPEWGPVGYDHADYYYMPDVDAYYDISNHQYVYYENNVWVHRGYLPARYRNYDVYHGYKVVVNQPNPWLRHNYYHNTYANYRGRANQAIIRDSRDARYSNHWHDPNHGSQGGRDDDHGGFRHDDHGQHGDDHGRPDNHGDNGHDDHGHHN